MSQRTTNLRRIETNLRQIEELEVNQLAEALELNGYAECVGAIRTKDIDGQAFLKLTEFQICLWRLPPLQARRLRRFIEQVREDPKVFLINSEANTKMVPKPVTNNSSKKPTVEQKPNISNKFEKSWQISKNENISNNKPISVTQKPNSLNKFQKPEQTELESKEAKFSTLSRQENKIFKDKLELFYKSGESPNSSFIYKQKQPQLPPKPDHLKVVVPTTDKFEEFKDSDDLNDGYLSPIKIDPNQLGRDPEAPQNESTPLTISRSNSNSTRSSFLHKFRKSYNHLEIRPKVIENNYEGQNPKSPKEIIRNRPLPAIPIETQDSYVPDDDIEFETDDELPAEYAAMLDDEKSNKTKEKDIKFHRPLPPVPVPSTTQFLGAQQSLNNYEDDEELAEYTPVIEEDHETESKRASTQGTLKKLQHFLPPLFIPASSPPSIPVSNINQSFKAKETKVKIPTPDSDQEQLTNNLQRASPNRSTKLSKPRAELPGSLATSPKFSGNLPKPPPGLPQAPLDLPSSPDIHCNSQEDLPALELSELLNQALKKRSPVPPSLELEQRIEDNELNEIEDELSFYSEIDVARESSYRETDRKGARRLLKGLENGAFVIRPSRQAQYICTFSIMHSTKMFNLGVQRDSEATLVFGSVMANFDQPKFYSVGEMVTYYSLHPLYLSGESIVLKDVLPRSRR